MRNLRIALIAPYDLGADSGVNANVFTSANELKERGHTVHIYGPLRSNQRIANDIFSVGSWIVALPNNGAKSFVNPYSLKWQSLRRKLASSYDVIHIHEAGAFGFNPGLVKALDRSKTANIATFHVTARNSIAHKMWGSVLHHLKYKRAAAQNIHRRLAVSAATLRYMEIHFPSDYDPAYPGFYTILPNPVDTKRFRPNLTKLTMVAGRQVFDPHAFNVLFVGRQEKRKGFPYLAESFANVYLSKGAQKKRLRLIICGAGKLDLQSCFQLSRLPSEAYIHYGRVDNHLLAHFYRSTDVLIAPAIEGEAQGMVLLEAMACGTPVVIFDTEGYHTVATGNPSQPYAPASQFYSRIPNTQHLFEGRGAVVVSPSQSVPGLEEAMLTLMQNPLLLTNLRGKALQNVVDHFSVRTIVDRLEAIYFQTLAELPQISHHNRRLYGQMSTALG